MSSPQGVVRRNGGLTPVAASDSPSLDFRNPENFFHDVNSVAGLLKQFFRDLQDPLLTREHYSAFIEAASKPPLSFPASKLYHHHNEYLISHMTTCCY